MTTEQILSDLDARHHRLIEALGKDKPSIFSEAAAEIRRLLAEVGKNGGSKWMS